MPMSKVQKFASSGMIVGAALLSSMAAAAETKPEKASRELEQIKPSNAPSLDRLKLTINEFVKEWLESTPNEPIC